MDLNFTHPCSKTQCTIKYIQVPVIPAFEITGHKAQGQTHIYIMVNLESCRGTESLYVMISCVTLLEGFLILQSFSINKIYC